MQPGAITGRVGGPLGQLPDRATGQSVRASLFGNFAVVTAQPRDTNEVIATVQHALIGATRTVLTRKLMRNEIAIPTIGHSMPALTPEIVQAANLEAPGIQIQSLELNVRVDAPEGPAPYAGPMPPDPMTAAASAYKQALAEELDPRNKEYEVRVDIGGFRLRGSTDQGFDGAGLGKQIKDKAVSNLIWWAGGCLIMSLVGIGVLGLGWYIYGEVLAGASGQGPATSSTVTEASWDGKTPFTCAAGQNLKLSKVKATLASGTAITASASCKLELVDVEIDAPVPLQALGNAEVSVKGGKLKGKPDAVKALGNAKVTLAGTTVEGKTSALGGAKITGP
jgi:hypothetical protein